MADLANLVVRISGDDSALHAAFGRAESRARGFASRLGGSLIGGPLRSVANLASNALTGAFLGVGAGLAYAGKKAVDLEAAFTQINKAANLPADQFQQLQRGIEGLATDASIAGVSLGDLTDIALQGAKLGIADKEGVGGLLQYTRALAMISVSIDDLPIAEVSKSLGQVSTIFGMTTDQALGYASAVDALDDSSTAAASGIFEVAQRAAGSAKSIGLGVDELLGLSTGLLNVGFNAEAAGTTLNRIFSEIATNPKQFAKGLGMDAKAFEGLGPMEKIQAVLSHLATLPEGSAGFAFLKEVGIDGAFAKQALLQLSQTQGQLAGFTRMAGEELRTHDHIMQSVGMNAATTKAAMQLLANNFDLTSKAIGDAFLPVLKALGAAFGEVAAGIRAHVDAHKGTMAGWQAAVVGAIDMVGVIWRNFGLIVEQTQLRITEKVINIQEILTWFGGVARDLLDWFGANWPTIFFDAFNAAWMIAQNALTNIANLAGETWGFISSLGKDPIEFSMKPLLEGFKATTAALPEIKGPQFTSMQSEIDAVSEKMFQGEMEHLARKEQGKTDAARTTGGAIGSAIGGVAGAALGIAGAAGAGGPTKPAGAAASTEMAGQTLGLPEYAKKLQAGALKDGDNHAKKTAKATQDTANGIKTLPEKIAGALGGLVVARAVGPA